MHEGYCSWNIEWHCEHFSLLILIRTDYCSAHHLYLYTGSWLLLYKQHTTFNAVVLLQGVYGWKLSPAVKSYRSYEKWDQPPEPEPFQVTLTKNKSMRLGL